jgi:hypothetical protein
LTTEPSDRVENIQGFLFTMESLIGKYILGGVGVNGDSPVTTRTAIATEKIMLSAPQAARLQV